ncbi:MAG: hypothetical protein JJU41_05100 [Bacteroidetes bacterium]|nr:hypothetical protein [Bacteroidota bacterium]MCH8525150.1 hypothetical protein [Balneolales bacterium]
MPNRVYCALFNRLLEKSEHPPKTYYFESYIADDVDDVDDLVGGFGFEFVFSRPGALTEIIFLEKELSCIDLDGYIPYTETKVIKLVL